MTMMEGRVRGGSGGLAPMAVDSNGAQIVSAGQRQCVGREVIAVGTGAASSLTPPGGAACCVIQADGGTLRVRQDAGAPTASVGSRIDDGVFYPVDTPLADVRLIAQSVACSAQVVYFDRT